MAIGDLFLITKAGLQSALIIGSLCIIVPMGLGVSDFSGHCLLWSNAHWDTNSSRHPDGHRALVVTEWGLQSNCTFGVFIGCVQLLVALFYAFFVGVHIYLQREASFLTVFFGLQLSLFFTISLVMEASIVTGGLFKWCLLMDVFQYGCEQAQFANILPDYPYIYSGRFLFTFGFARIGLWFSFLVWCIDLLLMLVQLARLHRRERFLVSLRREARMVRSRLYRDPDYVNI